MWWFIIRWHVTWKRENIILIVKIKNIHYFYLKSDDVVYDNMPHDNVVWERESKSWTYWNTHAIQSSKAENYFLHTFELVNDTWNLIQIIGSKV